MNICIRITTDEFNKEVIMEELYRNPDHTLVNDQNEIIPDNSPFSKIIVAEEMATHRHFHIFGLYIGEIGNGHNWARPIKRYLNQTFTIEGTQFSVSKARTDNAAPYTLKDGNFCYAGYTNEEIEQWKSESYEKPISYKERKRIIAEKYVNYEINTEQFLTQQIHLMCEFNVAYNRTNFKAYARTQIFKRDPSKINDEVFQLKLEL